MGLKKGTEFLYNKKWLKMKYKVLFRSEVLYFLILS